MPYRSRYRSYRYRGSGYNPPSKYSKLQNLFGAAVGEIRRQFFALDSEAMNELLADYGEMYGKSAESYARTTMPKWRSGATKLSGQTMERLIELVPPYLSAEQRLEVMKLILDKYKPTPGTRTIRVNLKSPDEGLAEIDAALNDLKITDELAFLPPRVMEAAKWLYDDDITTARAVLASISAAETNALRQSAEREINLLKRTLQTGQIKSASYTVQTPAGNLSIVAYQPSICFVATVCFGPSDYRTDKLRVWRDEVLTERELGRRFIFWYYSRGEEVSKAVGERPLLLFLTRLLLSLFVFILSKLMRSERGL